VGKSVGLVAAGSLDAVRDLLVARLRARRAELVAAIDARVHEAVPDPERDRDPELVDGLRKTICDAVDYLLETIEQGLFLPAGPPPAALAQTRRAARSGMPLQTMLRRYVVGYATIWDFVLEEADRIDLCGEQRTALLRQSASLQASFLDLLVGSVADQYTQEIERATRTREQRRAELVSKLVSGEVSDTDGLGYGLDGVHVGAIASGAGAEEALRRLSASLATRLLVVSRGEQILWAWLGGHELADEDVERVLRSEAADRVCVALGEPGQGVSGFRLTHRQASDAWRVRQRQPQPVTRYRDVALLALALEDDAVARSLIDIYLRPLDGQRDRGAVLRQTLRAYFAAGQNATSAAALLSVSRRTVSYRLRDVEDCLGCQISTRHAELETALKLEDLLAAPPAEPSLPTWKPSRSPFAPIGNAQPPAI
jgi:hypothetical protein